MSSQPAKTFVPISSLSKSEGHESRVRVRSHESNELFFALVGHVGSGTTLIARQLNELLESLGYESRVLKARDEITEWAENNFHDLPQLPIDSLDKIVRLQDLGDLMRSGGDHASVAAALALRIRATRAAYLKKDPNNAEPIRPDGRKRAYILDSLRHPEEVRLLQRLYAGGFTLIGAVCAENVRRERLVGKYTGADARSAEAFMLRDEGVTTEKHGQHVADAFELADFYLDNSEPRTLENDRPNSAWDIPDQLSRLLKIITHEDIQRPTAEETAMHAAHGARLRSACLSRQVGAALINDQGSILSLGTNEVPRAGGGVYGEYSPDNDDPFDGRCNVFKGFCRNTVEQNKMIDELLDVIPETRGISTQRKQMLRDELRNSRVGQLLEFSRSVHAEVAALLAAARQGKSTVGTRMFVTTFPCHYCARAIIVAGVKEVQYIEPYPKSKAFELHSDAMTASRTIHHEHSQSPRVLSRPFTGVSPRMYERAYLKDRDLKDKSTGAMKIGDAPWGGAWQLPSLSYVELEAKLAELKAKTEARGEQTVAKES
jgi:deoxycytidylate deaminase